MLYGPYRVLPGRLSVSRTFGDIEAKFEKYGGKPGVVSAVPEISQFTIDENVNDCIILGCDGIFDRLTSINVIDSVWSAMAQAVKVSQRQEQSIITRKPLTIHQISGKMADAVLKSSAIERSYDNLTVVIIAFKNLQNFFEETGRNQIAKTQTIKIEGENSPGIKRQQSASGYQSTKIKKNKEQMIDSGSRDAIRNYESQKTAGRMSAHSNRSDLQKQ